MTAKQILAALAKRGVTLKHDGTKLYADDGALSPDDVAAIEPLEAEIIELLQTKEKDTDAVIDEP